MSEVTEGMGPLDLSDADLEGFDAIDAGRYNVELVELTWDAVKNPNGKLPVGTPILKIQAKVVDHEQYENRRLFDQFTVPPKDYDAKKAATMKGFMARFFMALGYTEEQIKSPEFNPNFEDLQGQAAVAVVGKEPKKTRDADGELVVVPDEWNNPIKGWKPAGSLATAGEEASGLL